MLGKTTIRTALILLLAASSVYAKFPFHDAARIVAPTDGSELFFSDVCVDSSNQIHVIWSQTRVVSGNNRYLFYRRFSSNGQPTSDIVEFTPPGCELGGIPRIYCNRDSKIAVVGKIIDTLTDARSWSVWYSDGSGVFNPPVEYSSDQPSSFAKGRAGLGMNKAGRTAIAWEYTSEEFGNSTYYEVRDEQNQKIDTAKATRGGEFTYANAIVNQVAMNSSGRFVITWSANFAGDEHWFYDWGFFPMQPVARVFDAVGNPLTNEIYVACEGLPAACAGDSSDFVNAHASGQRPDVVIDENGEFSILYCRDGAQDCEKQHYFLRQFYADGTPKGPNIRVDDLSECYVTAPRESKLMSDSSGELLAIWANNNIDGVTANWWCNLYAQRFDLNGQRVGESYRLNNIPATYNSGIFGNVFGADMNEKGLVAIVWLDEQMIASGHGLCLQTMDVHDIGFFTPGDANRDLMVNISDPVFLINYIFAGGIPPVVSCLGDADGNDIITISDAVNLINYIFNGGSIVGTCP